MAVAELPVSPAIAGHARPAAAAVVRQVRRYFLVLSGLSLAAFILGVENRFTRAGLFFLPVPVDLIPPLSAGRWVEAFALHQQDPIFAACGGSETIEEFRTLYWWEWLRRLSVILLGAAALAGLFAATFTPRFRFAWRRLAGLGLIVLAFVIARIAVGFAVAAVDDLSRFNTGQYRHAVDVAFLSIAVAAVLAAAVAPPMPLAARRWRAVSGFAWLWLGGLVLDIAAGALYSARDAAAVATTWPGPFDQLVSYSPLWLNLAFNRYTIALVHHGLSAALFIAALAWLMRTMRQEPERASAALALVLLVAIEMAVGLATLALAAPALLSILHRVGAVVLLAGAAVVLIDPRDKPRVTGERRGRRLSKLRTAARPPRPGWPRRVSPPAARTPPCPRP